MKISNNNKFADHNPGLNALVSAFWDIVLKTNSICKGDKNQ